MHKFQHYSISKKLTWMNMLVSGAALLLACAAFVAYDLYTYQIGIARNLRYQVTTRQERAKHALTMLIMTPIAGLCETVGPFIAHSS